MRATISQETAAPAEPGPCICWHASALDRAQRGDAHTGAGATVWLTGLPGSGKSTIAVALEHCLVRDGRAAYLLDGDNLRHGLSSDLGFSDGDRAEQARRVGEVARLFADAGLVAIVALVSPLRVHRAVPRELHQAAGLPFLEVHVDAPVSECARRDPKGHYARARAGELGDFTGVDGAYEAPSAPDVHVPTAELEVGAAVALIRRALDEAR